MKTKNTALWILTSLLAGFAGGFVTKTLLNNNAAIVPCDTSAFLHINRNIVCGGVPVVQKHGYAALKSKIEKYVKSRIGENKLSNASVYLHDLQAGPTMGINEHTPFIPASLLKVPLMMTYLNLAGEKPELLQKMLGYRIDGVKSEVPQYYLPSEKIKENEPYTVEELLRRMVVYSDNDAYQVLFNYLQELSPNVNLLHETLREIGIFSPNSSNDSVITVKNYASLFQMLFNSSFFQTPEESEKALSLLTASNFHDGLTKKIPPDIEVAHKFGERFGHTGNEKQLHDCGIVYYPGNPYLLCVMTRGSDFNELSETIGDISRMTYEEFDSRRIK